MQKKTITTNFNNWKFDSTCHYFVSQLSILRPAIIILQLLLISSAWASFKIPIQRSNVWKSCYDLFYVIMLSIIDPHIYICNKLLYIQIFNYVFALGFGEIAYTIYIWGFRSGKEQNYCDKYMLWHFARRNL